MRILLVDDESGILEVYPEMFEQYTWYVAATLEAAQEILKTELIDVAIIDSLPYSKGLELAEKCSTMGIKTICHTGGSIISESCFFDAVVIKPSLDGISTCLNLFNEVENEA